MLIPFLRNYETKLDKQRRLTLPASSREAVGATAFIYKPPQFSCLYVYNAETWECVYNERVERTRDVANGEQIRRKFVSRMSTADVDSGSRITIPAKMLEAANIQVNKDIVILGSGKHMELWDAEIYRAEVEDASDETDTDVGYVM